MWRKKKEDENKAILNEYWFISDWVIYDIFHRLAHLEAKANLWACVNEHSEIEYFAQAKYDANIEDVKIVPVSFNSDNSCKVIVGNWYAMWTFTFIRN